MTLEVFLWSFNAVAPLLFTIIAGWFIAWRGHIDENGRAFLNRLCFKYLLPMSLFINTYSIDAEANYNYRLLVYCAAGIVVLALTSWAAFTFLIADRHTRAIFILSAFRTNNIIYGLPLAANLFGAAGTAAAVTVYPGSIISFNLLAVAVMVYFSQDGKDNIGAVIKKTASEIVRNPLVIACVLGSVCAVYRVSVPQWLKGGISSCASAATPVSLLLLGSQIDIESLRGNLKPALAACALRLLLIPAVMIPAMILAGFRGAELSALMVAFAAPPAVTSMVMARNYNIAPEFAAQTVYLGTIFSVGTIFCIIVILRTFGFM